jgi:hypothetical protein
MTDCNSTVCIRWFCLGRDRNDAAVRVLLINALLRVPS